ncbi:glycosyltransferase family 1 protein [Roseomonas nepalensis]|uniref:Glycosyltransferase family 1 protein n=1 Tax=Muricoccus nepalensis TaxID=1854500 RepID=A0A502F689_9PROT|nr:glycosyltransferase family 4 protein [Roseomonas nepalensis]TPG44261.1 glycosyltransferase family 1 protein [Roseomonas nepalensis]
MDGMSAVGDRPRARPDAAGRAERPLRILMVAARFLPDMGGIETHVNEAGRRLAAAGHQVTVLTTDRTGRRPIAEMRDGLEILRVPAWPRQRDYYLAPGLWGALMATDCDVVHIQGYHTLVPPLAMLAAIRKRVPFVITFHSGGHSSPWRNRIRALQSALLAPLVRRAARWIAVSRYEADRFSGEMGLPRERVAIVPNGAGLALDGAAGEASATEPLIVSIGRLERYKGHHRAIEAMPRLRARRPGARLRILGEGPYREELERLVARLGLGDCVEIGAVPPAERGRLAAVLRSASVVTLLSDYEAHPVAVMEALALGCPVLVTDGSGFMEMAERGMVRTVPLAASPEAIAEAMLATLAEPGGRAPLALPSWEACAGQLEAIYRDVGRDR